MPYGQHKGKRMDEVPAQYLLYILENHDLTRQEAVKKYIVANQDTLIRQVNWSKKYR
jgi:hypothetical protein